MSLVSRAGFTGMGPEQSHRALHSERHVLGAMLV